MIRSQFILGVICGVIAMAVLEFMTLDWRAHAAMGEAERCRDEPDTKAYMARLPGKAHTVEHCIHAIRFGSPSWVPELGHPLQPRREGK